MRDQKAGGGVRSRIPKIEVTMIDRRNEATFVRGKQRCSREGYRAIHRFYFHFCAFSRSSPALNASGKGGVSVAVS